MPSHDQPTPGADTLYEDAACGLLLSASDGTLLRVNRTFCGWMGLEAGALLGRRFQDLLTMGGRIFHQTHFGPLLHMQGSVSEVKLDLVRGDSESVPVVVNAVRRMHGERVLDEIAVFIAKDRHAYERELMRARHRAEDLAERHGQAQRELERADRRKDEFLAMLAHELRNPLAPISTAAQLLRVAGDDATRLRPLGDVIARQAAHLTALVDDLLDVSRVTRGQIQLEYETLDPADLVDAAIEQSRPLIETRRHRLEVVAPRGFAVRGDRTRLVQVLANLLNNAAKYSPPGSAITLAVDAPEDEVRLCVSDTGLGIEADLLPHIFDLFAQAERTPDRAQGGLGIGLALVRSLVALHGGTIEAHSDGLHRGSRFTVRLPRVAPVHVAATPAPPVPVRASPLDILIVDDNVDAACMLEQMLVIDGHRPVIAQTAADAIAIASRQAFDVCILDIGLPDMTGYDLARVLREHAGTAIHVALTGYGQPHDRVLSKDAGFDHHLVKPVDVARLAAILAGVQRPARATA